jgi:hypothetical protein
MCRPVRLDITKNTVVHGRWTALSLAIPTAIAQNKSPQTVFLGQKRRNGVLAAVGQEACATGEDENLLARR